MVWPSRKQRHTRKRTYSLTTLVSTGLVLFGTIFFGLILVELYQANKSVETTTVLKLTLTERDQPQVVSDLSVSEPLHKENPQNKVPETPMTVPAISPKVEMKSIKTIPAKNQDPKPTVKRHVVQKGDTLFKLSREYYGNQSGVTRIARYNGLDPKQGLLLGKVILIPFGSK